MTAPHPPWQEAMAMARLDHLNRTIGRLRALNAELLAVLEAIESCLDGKQAMRDLARAAIEHAKEDM